MNFNAISLSSIRILRREYEKIFLFTFWTYGLKRLRTFYAPKNAF